MDYVGYGISGHDSGLVCRYRCPWQDEEGLVYVVERA